MTSHLLSPQEYLDLQPSQILWELYKPDQAPLRFTAQIMIEAQSWHKITTTGAMGISGGGLDTFFSNCLDSRIKACVISGYFSTFAASIFVMDHCAYNFITGLSRFGEIYDLVGLITPRPILVEAATRDPIFPR